MEKPINTAINGDRDNKGRFLPENKAATDRGQNKLTKAFRSLLLETIETLNADPSTSFLQFAKDYPKEFWAIAAKLIPVEVTTTLKRTVEDKYTPEEIDAAIENSIAGIISNSEDQKMPD